MHLRWHFCAILLCVACGIALAQDRITSQIDLNPTVHLEGNVHPLAQAQNDQGLVDPSMQLEMLTVLLKPSAIQQAALDQLLADQQNPSSQDYHRWLTPEQFANRFGASTGDIAKIRAWLENQGLHINDMARGRGWITFSGTAKSVSGA